MPTDSGGVRWAGSPEAKLSAHGGRDAATSCHPQRNGCIPVSVCLQPPSGQITTGHCWEGCIEHAYRLWRCAVGWVAGSEAICSPGSGHISASKTPRDVAPGQQINPFLRFLM